MHWKLTVLVLTATLGCGHSQHGGGGGGGGESGGGSGPVPVEVRKTVERLLGPNARIDAEREGGVLIYEAAIQTKLELELDAAGTLKTTEVALPIGTLPAAVLATARSKGTIKEAEVLITATGVVFEVEIGDTEYTIDVSGAILSTEHEAGDTGDDED